jgi:hypothetical protein
VQYHSITETEVALKQGKYAKCHRHISQPGNIPELKSKNIAECCQQNTNFRKEGKWSLNLLRAQND